MMDFDSALSRTSPESVGIPPAALAKTMEELKKLDSLNSIMVMRRGKVCMEAWWAPFTPETPHILFSLSKSFTSAAVGLAQEEGLLNINDRLCTFFPEYDKEISDPRMREVTLRHLLTMASGHAGCARPFMLADPENNWPRGFLSSKLDFEPGTRFIYNSAATYMLAAVLRKVTGENVREYLMPRLFAPLRITPGIWECCPRGTNCGGWGLYLKTEDLAKFAQLLLNGGVWEGRQILPADYLKEATSKQIDNYDNEFPDWSQGYGYQFWRCQHDAFRGDGASGQVALVVPGKELAVAVTAGLSNMQTILTIIWENLLPYLKDEPLPENPGEQAELAKSLENLQVPLAKGDISRRHEPAAWDFDLAETGISRAAITFSENTCHLEFRTARGIETLSAGFGFNCRNLLQLNDKMIRKTAASAAWISENVLEIHLCSYEASFREILTVDFSSPDKPLSGSSRFCTFRRPFLF